MASAFHAFWRPPLDLPVCAGIYGRLTPVLVTFQTFLGSPLSWKRRVGLQRPLVSGPLLNAFRLTGPMTEVPRHRVCQLLAAQRLEGIHSARRIRGNRNGRDSDNPEQHRDTHENARAPRLDAIQNPG